MNQKQTIIENQSGAVLEIILNRPNQLNAFNEEMHLAFSQSLKRAHDDNDIRAILITGNGRGFCAGQDLGDRNPDDRDDAPDLGKTLSDFYHPSIRLIRSLAKPIICAVNGVAAGAGVSLALGCDIILASEKARFIQSFAKIGLVPDAGGSWLLPRLIGEMRAKALTMTASPLSAAQAKEWGLVWEIFAEEELLPNARKLSQELAEGPTFGLGLTKRAIQAAATQSLDEQLEMEADFQRQAGQSDDYAEGVRAFLQKRAPKFKGR